jgi:hypothetical protein
MLSNDITELSAMWLEAKQQEADATARRRDIEDHLARLAGIREDLDGTESIESGEYCVKIVGRIDRKVDSERLQELAAETGLTGHLTSLFRWKPEINMTAWKAADESITKQLAGAITAKPGRPSFKITTTAN